MKSFDNLIRFWILMAVLGSSAFGAGDPPMFDPFSVTIGEPEARMENPGDLSAVIEKPIKSNDWLKIDRKADILKFLKGDS